MMHKGPAGLVGGTDPLTRAAYAITQLPILTVSGQYKGNYVRLEEALNAITKVYQSKVNA